MRGKGGWGGPEGQVLVWEARALLHLPTDACRMRPRPLVPLHLPEPGALLSSRQRGISPRN